MGWRLLASLAAAMMAVSVPAGAQVALDAPATTTQPDAAAVAQRLSLTPEEAARQLALQEASVPVTDALAERFAGRLAGIAIEHTPAFRIVVRLTGDVAVPDEIATAAGEAIPVTYRTGAAATHVELVQAITAYQAAIRASLITPPGLGVDQRTGEIVAVVSAADVAREGADALRARLAALTHVPVRLRVVDQPTLDLGGVEGGARLIGSNPGAPTRYVCTAGFVVTDGTRTALATAAHCPDELSARDAGGAEVALPFVAQWGWGNQDVQINASATPLAPAFYADAARTISRPVLASRPRAATRAGDLVCHRGERTGYSCAPVELTDFAPAGDLCGGACLPTWTTVAGPSCKGGDSGGPVFMGSTAFGILKGGSYRSDGSCAFYFYMSVDFLPPGWRLLTVRDVPSGIAPAEDGAPLGGG